jgi:hypothetical protein
LAPGVRLLDGVRPAKKQRRQRTTAATVFSQTPPPFTRLRPETDH